MFKKFCLWASANIFLFSVSFLVIMSGTFLLIKPPHLKNWVQKSGAYSQLGTVVIDNAAKSQAKEASSSSLVMSDKLVQQAAKDTLSPSFYQQTTEEVIDGSFSWLEGKSSQPDFAVNVSKTKEDFADRLISLAKKRYKKLPNCTSALFVSSDPIKATCKASGEDFNQITAEYKKEILADQLFLPEKSFSPNSISLVNGKNFFERKTFIPQVYQAFNLLPLVFGVIALVSGLLVIFLCQNKVFGLRKIGWRLIVASIFGAITVVLEMFASASIKSAILRQKEDSAIHLYKNIIAAGLDAAKQDFVIYTAAVSGVMLLLGLVILIATKSQSKKKRNNSPEIIESDEDKKIKKAIAKEGRKEEDKIDLKSEETVMPEISINNRPEPPKKKPVSPTKTAPKLPSNSKKSNLIQ